MWNYTYQSFGSKEKECGWRVIRKTICVVLRPYRQEAIGQVEPFTACAYHAGNGVIVGAEGLALPNQIESAQG